MVDFESRLALRLKKRAELEAGTDDAAYEAEKECIAKMVVAAAEGDDVDNDVEECKRESSDGGGEEEDKDEDETKAKASEVMLAAETSLARRSASVRRRSLKDDKRAVISEMFNTIKLSDTESSAEHIEQADLQKVGVRGWGVREREGEPGAVSLMVFSSFCLSLLSCLSPSLCLSAFLPFCISAFLPFCISAFLHFSPPPPPPPTPNSFCTKTAGGTLVKRTGRSCGELSTTTSRTRSTGQSSSTCSSGRRTRRRRRLRATNGGARRRVGERPRE